MYAPDRDYQDRDYQDCYYQDRSYQDRDYQDEGDEQERYYGGERSYIYKGPAAGALVPRNQNQGADVYDPRSNQGYDDRGYDQPRGRPGPQRRGSSWSPPRSRKHHDSRKKERGGSRDKGTERRMVAGIGGAIVGGYAGYALSKKSKDPDRLGGQVGTVATVVGAIAGALGGREAAEFFDHDQNKHDNKEENWEEKWGKGEDTGHNRPQYRNQ